MSGPVLGIDFGTTNTAAAWCDEKGKVHLVPVQPKRFTLPSVVWYGDDGRTLVGRVAQKQAIDDPERTIIGVKRFLGRRYKSEFVTRNKDRYGYEVAEDEKGLCALVVGGALTPATDPVFHILQRIVELATRAAKHEFDEVVLTVPAHFTYPQRRAVRMAAEMAGLEVRAMVNEPTAAALYYARHKEAGGQVMVYDLGGGTFDATLLHVQKREVRVIATAGDAFLGGQDFDSAIVDHLCDAFSAEHQIDLKDQNVVVQRLRIAAEQAKVRLSKDERTEIRVPFVAQQGGGFLDLDTSLTRDELESLAQGLIARSVGIVDDVLQRAGADPVDVDELVFVGGQTRMPAIQSRLTQNFSTDPEKNIHPDLGVAVGAAILGRTLDMEKGPALVDVTPMPIGVMLPAVGTKEVIPANAPVPCRYAIELDARPAPGQPLAFAVYEAVDATSVDRELLGTIMVPPDWLAAHPGDLALTLGIGPDFELSVEVIAGAFGETFELR